MTKKITKANEAIVNEAVENTAVDTAVDAAIDTAAETTEVPKKKAAAKKTAAKKTTTGAKTEKVEAPSEEKVDEKATDKKTPAKKSKVKTKIIKTEDSETWVIGPDTDEATPNSSDDNVGEAKAAATEGKPKRTRKKKVAEPKTDVVTIGDEKTVKTDEDYLRECILDLIESKKTGKILTDTITGIEQHGNVKVAVLYHGDLKVIIPADFLIPSSSVPKSAENYQAAIGNSTIKHLGAEVDYIVEEFDNENNVAIANRLKAMKAKQKHYYYGYDRQGNKLIYPDAYCEARVVSVIRNGVFVEVFGVEAFVKISELSYQRIVNTKDHFATGMTVLVKVLALDTSDKDNIKIAVSIKQAKENPASKALSKISVGNYYMGTVTMVDIYGVFVSLDCGIDCLCKHPIYERPVRGERASVRIAGVSEKTNQVWGDITHTSNVF